MTASEDMPRPRLLITRRLPEQVHERARQRYACIENPNDVCEDGRHLADKARDCDALLVTPTDRLSADVIARLPKRVKAIATFSVGFDHIDLDAARARGIVVTNTPDVVTEATAEIAMLCLLGAARRASEGERMMRADRWTGWAPTQLLGTQLTAKTLGIVGYGRIGQATADRARGFGLSIAYTATKRRPATQEKGATFYASLEEMLPRCHFLSLHCPATPETHHLLNAERLALLPKGAIVVNTARGAVIDDQALIAALRSGHVAAAGLDVFEGEPNINPAYRDLDNTFLLPHLGTATLETRVAMGMRALDNLDAVFANREPADRLV